MPYQLKTLITLKIRNLTLSGALLILFLVVHSCATDNDTILLQKDNLSNIKIIEAKEYSATCSGCTPDPGWNCTNYDHNNTVIASGEIPW